METVKFEELGLYPQLLRAIKEMGFEEATPIQSQAIPVVMSGVDVIGQAQTGTGKTASFGIPLLMKVDPNNKKTQAIVLSPTRELAIQSAEEIRKLAKYMHGIKVLPIYGGQDISRQIKALKGGATIIIGTPGRVMDHLRRKTIRCDYINTIVLDEADEMLNMGFREDIETILSYIPDEDRQTVLFSATMPKPILEITRKFQHDATTIKVTKKELTVPNIDQYYYDVRRNDKMEVLTRLLDYYNPKLSLVFCNTKRMVDELASELQGRGYAAEGIHGDMKQVQRDRVMKKFRNGKTDILIATDVAARGIDVDDVEAVFNYDLPQDNEYYVHRIGRTGRAGRTGKAFNFVKGKEVYKLKEIQRYCKTKIKAQPIPSSDDVAAIKADKILDGIGQIIEDGDLRDMIELIEQQVNNSDYTAMDIAAAFLKQAIGGVELSKEDHEFDDALAGDTGAEEGMVRLFINIGKSQRIRPGDILGAVAGEANVPFFSMSGSEFVEMFVGMGASKVRDLFGQAKEKAPCIVFIDEIDAIGKKRDGQMGGNDEREQTLNQLLTEMDGFEGNNGVIILAATNRPESLDPALTRPGRFDRRVPVELPDLAGREAILKVHAKKIKASDDVDLHTIARMASGASGAELANIINEAALRAVRSGRTVVNESDLEESIEVVIAGYQKKNAVLSDQEKKVVAYHEIGHALVAALQSHSAPVQKITIIPRTSGALGYTMQVEQGDKYLMTKKELENKIATFTGGRAAEEIVFGEITTGASNDIEQATKIARAMITRYGMTDEFDMVAMENVTNQYLGGDTSLSCSADTQKEIDEKVVQLVKACLLYTSPSPRDS